MHFTVHMRSKGAYAEDYSYGLVFIPCPVWIKGDKEILNLNPKRPTYQLGSIKKLIKKENISNKFPYAKSAYVIVHPIGHGSIADFSTLLKDLQSEGFTVQVCGELGSNCNVIPTET